MFKKSPHSLRLQLIIGLVALDGAFFMLTDPRQVASIVIIIGFLLLSLTLYLLISRLCVASQLYGLPFGRQSHRIALFGTGVIAGLIALQSIGELTVRDMLVAVPLSTVMYLYFSYGRAKARIARPNTA